MEKITLHAVEKLGILTEEWEKRSHLNISKFENVLGSTGMLSGWPENVLGSTGYAFWMAPRKATTGIVPRTEHSRGSGGGGT